MSESTHRALLACGVLASLVYVAANVVASLAWPEYSSTGQTISELSAIDAPSRAAWLPFGFAYNVLMIAFAFGVWRSAGGRRGLRVSAALLLAIGALGPFWPPMHLRGVTPTLTDTMHVVFASVVSVLIMLAIGFGASALGKRFRWYSLATLATLVVCGAMTFRYGPAVAANLPTPWIGIFERIDVGGYLLWVAVLAIALYARQRAARRSSVDRHPGDASFAGAR